MPRVFISKRSATPCISSRSTIASSPRARTEICGNRDPATARGFDLASKLSPKLRRARTTRSSGQSPILARACWCSAALPIFRTIGMAWLASVYTICPLRDVWKWVGCGLTAFGPGEQKAASRLAAQKMTSSASSGRRAHSGPARSLRSGVYWAGGLSA